MRECQRNYDDGLDQDQRSRLKKRERKSDTKTDEDKWRAIYKTLFPGEVAISTPYCNDSELDDYHRYCRENSDRILGDKLGAIPGGVWSGSAQQMKELVRDVQEQLFGEFHTQQNDDDHSSCTSRGSTPMSASPMTPSYFDENPPMTAADPEVHTSKRRRVGEEAYFLNDHVTYQGTLTPQIRVSPACEAFMEGNLIAELSLDGNLSPLPAQSAHEAALGPGPDQIPPSSTAMLDSGMSDAQISGFPDPWGLEWTFLAP
ncbi:Zn2 cys6 DNA-binding protein [Lasiodiplodia theobromae]|uniref:Uncharacterized protein n=1 Tax=Lasiodiplodia theobromae TaxID=45133 RepID=A0A5N5D318_9PEZI|nr:Zn2 cys6 DNA-binding protein [Lasiodiplodia theobromae]KAB2572070.1 hypothetical protein DBV05_g9298 [Lasiodiplodia theobromae]KAF4544914.1 Zn2 cys6 DNA-binding protein [Lasiodiplodia theobromae]